MLHYKATTKLIMSELSSEIELLFSIRQGDPLAMILYIIYMEPYLIALEEELSGFTMGHSIQVDCCENIEQKVEAFCDDINAVTSNLDDFLVIEKVSKKFELSSGAILSRNLKCKVVGFGAWATKEDWPVPWIKPVKTVKIFGIIICNSYREMVRLNWDYRFKNFSDAIYSWKNRFLETLSQRVEVLRTFALSRVFYVAAILPLGKTMVRKFESLMGKFLWNFSGKLLRISLVDLKNPKLAGGLNLPCVDKMAQA